MLASLKKWFKGAFKHIRLEGYGPNSTGRKLLELLTGSLQTFGSVANHAPDLFELLKKEAQDQSDNVRQAALASLWSLIQGAPARAQEALPIIREVFTAEDGSISEVALGFLSQASLEQLLAHYWSKPDASLIPYIHPRLYHTPLVVGKSSQPSKQQVTLYAIAGEPERYPQPAGVVQDFVDRIKAEAS